MVASWEKVGRSAGLQAQHLRITEYNSCGQSKGLSNRSPSRSTLYKIYKKHNMSLITAAVNKQNAAFFTILLHQINICTCLPDSPSQGSSQ